MNPLHTPKRLKNNETEWLCENCGWVLGHLINVTGYTELACEHCDKTLEPDYYGFAELEKMIKPAHAGNGEAHDSFDSSK